MYFDKKQVNYMEAASWSKSQSCTYTLVFKFVVWFDIRTIYVCILGFCAICIGYCGYHCFYAFITYLLFAVPVQLWLRKKPKSLVWFIFSFIQQSLFSCVLVLVHR